MGKLGDVEQAVASPALATNRGFVRSTLRPYAAAISDALAVRCVFLLLLGIGAFLPVFFLLLSLRPSGIISDNPDADAAEIQASFILLKPASLLAPHVRKLERDIFADVGVPNSKVSVISMQPLASWNSTYVTFGVLPDPENASISSPSLSVLKSTLIGLTLEQLNLSLTPSVFGNPFCLEMLGFPGGITVAPTQSDSILESTEPLFNFTLNNSIHQIREHLDELKDQLRLAMKLTPDENLYVQLTNENGSTVTPPVTIHASFFSNGGNYDRQPHRLKQLAQIITAPDLKNLGLNHSMFGTIKDLKLSRYLQYSSSSFAPSPSPLPLTSLSIPPSSHSTIIHPHKHSSCHTLTITPNIAISPHHKLFRLSSMLIPPQLPKKSHSPNTSGNKKSSTALPSPMPVSPAVSPT